MSSISAYSPYMSGLGAYGLGTGSSFGSYGSYGLGDYSMMGMTGGMGMMGMYNPSFMAQMNQAYQDMEKSQLQHSSAMHELMKQSEVAASKADDTALFQKSMEDARLNGLTLNLAKKVREGDADGICEEFDKLKIAIYQKYQSDFEANKDRLDPSDTANGMIENLYASIISKKTGETVTLRSDLEKYGETAFMHGFNKEYFGKSDYHDKYTEETLHYLFGERIDNKRGKDRMESIGGGLGHVAEAATAGAAGVAVGIGGTGAGAVLSSHVKSALETDCFKKLGRVGKLVGLAALGADIVWQVTR